MTTSEYRKAYYQKNKEKEKAYAIAYNKKHPEYRKKYYQEHREELCAYQKKVREEHPEVHANWVKNNKDKVKAIKDRYRKKVALHKKRVKQAKFQYRDEKGRFCKWEEKPLNYLPALRLLTAITLLK